MRRLMFDQDEFDPLDSEQSLELALSDPTRHRDLGDFLAKCGASVVSGRTPDAGWDRWVMVRFHLREFSGLRLPSLDECREVLVLSDEWNDVEAAIVTETELIWYHWSTSA